MGSSASLFGLLLLASTALSVNHQIGDCVTVVKNAPLQVGCTVVEHAVPGTTFRVAEIHGRRLWVSGTKPGWIDCKYVISQNRASEYFAVALQRDPKNTALLHAQSLVGEASDAPSTTLDLSEVARHFDALLKIDDRSEDTLDVDWKVVGHSESQLLVERIEFRLPVPDDLDRLGWRGSSVYCLPNRRNISSNYVEQYRAAIVLFALNTQVDLALSSGNAVVQDEIPSPAEHSRRACDSSWIRAFYYQDAAVLAGLGLSNEPADITPGNGGHRPIAVSGPGSDKLLSRIQRLLDRLPTRRTGQIYRRCEPELTIQVVQAESSETVGGVQICRLFVGDSGMEMEESVPSDECFGTPYFLESP